MGIEQLRRVVQIHPDRVEAWDGLLTGLVSRAKSIAWKKKWSDSQRPWPVADAAQTSGQDRQDANRWKEAVDLFRRARAEEPYNRVVEYRLSRALRHAGEAAEAGRIEERRSQPGDGPHRSCGPLFDQAVAIPDLGIGPHQVLYQRIAASREQMQLPEEATRGTDWYCCTTPRTK